MTKAVALVRTHAAMATHEALRVAIVAGCAIALILAAEPLPF